MCKEVELTGENALQRLPEAFYVAFAGELVSVFGVDIFQVDPDVEGAKAIDYLTGSCGWHLILMAVCKRLGCEWFYEWYDSLDWEGSDKFDCDLLDALKARVSDPEEKSRHAYYEWLVKESGLVNQVDSR